MPLHAVMRFTVSFWCFGRQATKRRCNTYSTVSLHWVSLRSLVIGKYPGGCARPLSQPSTWPSHLVSPPPHHFQLHAVCELMHGRFRNCSVVWA